MTFEQIYKHALTEVYKDELLAWLKNQSTSNYYVIVWKDNEPTYLIVDRNAYYKHYCNIENNKKVIATVSSDKMIFTSISNVVQLIKNCLNKLNQKLFENAYNKFMNNANIDRKAQITFIVDHLATLDSKALTKFINYITSKTYDSYLQSKAYQQHLLRLNHYEQEAKTKALTKELVNAKAQVKYYKDKVDTASVKAASKELSILRKLLKSKSQLNVLEYINERISSLKGASNECLANQE